MSTSTHSPSPPNSNNSLSPTHNTFTPRPEFLSSSIVSQRHTFALLTLSSTSSLRLYSFPSPLIASVRALLTSRNLIHAVRETDRQSMIEFSLHGKLWTQPKSVPTERLLVDLYAVMYRAGWTYVSTIDYGREHDDRLAMTFRRGGDDLQGNADKLALVPFALSFPNATLLRVVGPPLHSTPAILAAVRGSWPRGVVNEKKVGDGVYEFRLKGYRWFEEDTFATDSLTHILGLLSSLDGHGFSLLTSLCLTNNRSRVKDLWIFTGPPPPDSPTGSTFITSQSPILGHQKMPSLPTPLPLSPVSSSSTNGNIYHQRAATSPAHAVGISPLPQPHPVQQPVIASPPASPGVLRKPAPRAQVPISVISQSSEMGDPHPSGNSSSSNKPAPRAQVPESIIDDDIHVSAGSRPRTGDLPPFGSPAREEFGVRANIPSRVPEDVEDMTGVGTTIGQKTPDVFYTTSPFTPTAQANGYGPDTDSFYDAAGGVVEMGHQGRADGAQEPFGQNGPETEDDGRISNILHPNAFRSMALTSGSRSTSDNSQPRAHPSPPLDREDSVATRQIPIAWTGAAERKGQESFLVSPPPPLDTRISSTPFFPGAWAPTPVHELPVHHPSVAEPVESDDDDDEQGRQMPVQDNEDRVASPTISAPEHGRKSEAGLVVTLEDGEWKTAKAPVPMVPTRIPSPAPSPVPAPAPNGAVPHLNGTAAPPTPVGGQGWVIVDVAGQSSTTPTSPQSSAPFPPSSPISGKNPSLHSGSHNHRLDEQAALSPSAKAIAMVDAVQEREKERNESSLAGLSRITSTPKTQESVSSMSTPGRSNSHSSRNTGGSVKRFLSLSSPRKDKDKDGEKRSLRNRLRKWA